MNFSQELIDQVVDFVYDDHRTLCVIRLVSRSWNISARIHFFCELHLLIPWTPYPDLDLESVKFTRLLDILNTSLDMAYFVRDVTIDTSGMTIAKWKIYDPLLSNILTQLKRVTTICLRKVYWSQLPPSFSSSLMNLFKYVEHLHMWGCSVPNLDFLNSSYALTRLRLSHFDFKTFHPTKTISPTIDESSTTTKKKPQLQCLHIDTEPPVPLFYALLSTNSIDFTKLRSLILEKIHDTLGVCHILEIAGSSLESLTMPASFFQICNSPTIDLNHAPRLKYLQVSGLQWLSNVCPSACLYRFFENISTPHSLQTLDIIIIESDETDRLDFTQWNSFDQLLSRPVFPVLQEVNITVYSDCFDLSNADRLIEAFPQLQACRKVHVNIPYYYLA